MQLRPFPTDPRLTGIVIAYRNAELIADRILPRLEAGIPYYLHLPAPAP